MDMDALASADPPKPPPPPSGSSSKQEFDRPSRWAFSPSSDSRESSAGSSSSFYGNEGTSTSNASYGGGGMVDSNNGSGQMSSSSSINNNNGIFSPGNSRPKMYSNNSAPPPPDNLSAKPPPVMEYQRPTYSLPGVLHFLQHEWTRFELDRAQWEVERAELQARVAFLQGERKSQESLKVDLVRRIKMLELALRHERNSSAKLKREAEGGSPAAAANLVDAASNRTKPKDVDSDYAMNDVGYGDYIRGNGQNAENAISGISWKEGRHLLRQYLKEIGYADSLINVRQARVRAALGAAGRHVEPSARNEHQSKSSPQDFTKSVMDSVVLAAENAICASFDFRNTSERPASEEDEEDSDDDDAEDESAGSFPGHFQRDKKSRRTMIPRPAKSHSNEDMANVSADTDTEAAMKEFDFLPADEGSGETRSTEGDWSPQSEKPKEEIKMDQKDRRAAHRPKRSQLQEMLSNLKQEEDVTDLTSAKGAAGSGIFFTPLPEMQMPFAAGGSSAADGTFALGELAALTINNDTENAGYDLSLANSREETTRKTWSTKYTLRSHFDGVRSLAFHPEDLMLMTASDDGTLKYWNLFRNFNGNKKSVDFEPVHTFRGHTGPVLSCCMNHNGDFCISGSADSTVRFWNLSCTTGDPYDAYDPSIVGPVNTQHTDAVWHLKHHPTQPFMVSCSADGRLMWWNTEKLAVLTQIGVSDWGAPSSADVFPSELGKVSASYAHHAAVFDVETGTPVVKFKLPENDKDFVYRIVNHPSLPISITAHEDRSVRFFDTNTGEMVHSMAAHLDAVSSVAVDPNGLYVITGSHDSSVRFWGMDSKTCVQEFTAHRKKLDESVFDVAFHPTKNHVASAGADGIAKVYYA